MPGEDFMSWSVTAASNANADAGINWQENQPRNSVNNSARSMMAAMAKDRKLRNGGYITTGTANAQIITSDVGYTAGAAPTGIIVRPKVGPALTNTGPMTLQLDATTAAPVKDLLGGDVMSGNWIAGSYPEVIFDGTNWLLIGSVVGWATGDIKLTYKSVADDGWIMMDDGSIGDATSGGTTRANADTLGLFTLFYASPFTDATAPIQTSSGAATTRSDPCSRRTRRGRPTWCPSATAAWRRRPLPFCAARLASWPAIFLRCQSVAFPRSSTEMLT